jgi:hypothetical protein
VETGIDENGNGTLDDSEVDDAQKVCHGAPGTNGLHALISLTQEPAGTNCTLGGVQIDTGIDTDRDGVLDPGEVTSTVYLCNSTGQAPGWGTAAPIETDSVANAANPQVAVDGSGNAVAVWYQLDGTGNNIWANRFVPATGWGTATLIETDAGTAVNPQVAIDGNGNAVAVWPQGTVTRHNIWANRFVPATGWGTATLIETDDAGDALDPQVAVDGSGNAVAVWRQDNGTGTRTNIWASRFVPATGWGTATLVETDNAGDALVPQVAVDGSGNAVAVWYQSDGTRSNIWANRFVAP